MPIWGREVQSYREIPIIWFSAWDIAPAWYIDDSGSFASREEFIREKIGQ